jgi:hypothetical protein
MSIRPSMPWSCRSTTNSHPGARPHPNRGCHSSPAARGARDYRRNGLNMLDGMLLGRCMHTPTGASLRNGNPPRQPRLTARTTRSRRSTEYGRAIHGWLSLSSSQFKSQQPHVVNPKSIRQIRNRSSVTAGTGVTDDAPDFGFRLQCHTGVSPRARAMRWTREEAGGCSCEFPSATRQLVVGMCCVMVLFLTVGWRID